MKLAIRRYCNEAHGILTAQDIRKSQVEKGVKGTTASVNTINETKKFLKMKDITNISTYTTSESVESTWNRARKID